MENTLETAYKFYFKNNKGELLPLKNFEGRVLLIVNTASQCGFTKQYEGLEHLYQKYKDRGLTILAIPSNDFGNQEPGTDEEIQQFCKLHFAVSFPVAQKEVITGPQAHPFYIWAKEKLGFLKTPKWNFHKYLIDRHGNLVDYFYSTTSPENRRITKRVEELL